MSIATTDTLGSIVTTHPDLARELERSGLDYCCGGRRTLADACADVGLDPEEVAASLRGAIDPTKAAAPWAAMDADELAVHLVETHHRYLWDELPRLAALAAKLVEVHGARHPELVEIEACVRAIRDDLEPHLLKEERILFPMIHELAGATAAPALHCGSIRNPISVMLREHDDVGSLLARLRSLTTDYSVPADGCATYRACFTGLQDLEADTHLHIHKENNVLFPMVEEIERAMSVSA